MSLRLVNDKRTRNLTQGELFQDPETLFRNFSQIMKFEELGCVTSKSFEGSILSNAPLLLVMGLSPCNQKGILSRLGLSLTDLRQLSPRAISDQLV